MGPLPLKYSYTVYFYSELLSDLSISAFESRITRNLREAHQDMLKMEREQEPVE